MITDFSQYKPPALESIQPLDLSAPSFVMVTEDKGDNRERPESYDPEPQYEKMLKAQGVTIKDVRVDVS